MAQSGKNKIRIKEISERIKRNERKGRYERQENIKEYFLFSKKVFEKRKKTFSMLWTWEPCLSIY